MEDDIAKQLDSFSLNEEESSYVGLSNTEVESREETSDRSVFAIVYGGGANKAACLPRHSVPHLIHNMPPIHLMYHSTNLPVNPINRGKSPTTPVLSNKGSEKGQSPPIITISIKKSSGKMQGNTTFVIDPKAKEISAPDSAMLID
ncbi:hypothetical protein M9H77_12577 [Catharanthus roseus]|uniref:Uncharacterized protein n=1 Tax=Catharanthus roseus TaxID=4058 RepID=A0ACC0BHZ0_CATRO|nr:hypothetical protein M9H77_12577 [Catharanthus roseus]